MHAFTDQNVINYQTIYLFDLFVDKSALDGPDLSLPTGVLSLPGIIRNAPVPALWKVRVVPFESRLAPRHK